MARKAAPGNLDEDAWLEVIGKMDEVYSQLVQDEIALEEKNAELEQSQQFIAGLLSSMSDVLLACDPDGRIEESNNALRTLVGRDEQILLGSPVYALLADARSDEQLRKTLAGLRRPNASASLELNFKDALGAPLPVDISCTVRSTGNGRCIGHVLVGRPLGELKHAYRQLHEAHEALKRTQQQLLHAEKMASLGRLVAGVAHELNNPISFVLANAHVLGGYRERLEQYLEAVNADEPREIREALRRQLRIDPLLADLRTEALFGGGSRDAGRGRAERSGRAGHSLDHPGHRTGPARALAPRRCTLRARQQRAVAASADEPDAKRLRRRPGRRARNTGSVDKRRPGARLGHPAPAR